MHGAPNGWFKPGAGRLEWFKDHEQAPEMIVVPAGSFMMGSPGTELGRCDNEGPQHKATFARPFAVGRFALTFDEWDASVADGGCNGYKPDDRGWGRERLLSTGRGISSLWGAQFSPLGGVAISRFLDQRLGFSVVDHGA